MKLTFKKIFFVGALLSSGMAVADSYNIDLGATFTQYKDKYDKQNVYAATGAYYFNAVSIDNVPLAEAAFLGKNSNVNASTEHQSDNDVNYNNSRIGTEFYIPESFLYVAAGGSRSKFAYNYNNFHGEHTSNDWDAAIGITPIDGLLVATHYDHDQGYNANISAKYVAAIGGDKFFSVEASVVDLDRGSYNKVGGDFYFDHSFSVGGSITQSGSEKAYEIRTRKFFTEQISGELSYSDMPDGESIAMLGASVRF